MKQVRNIGDVPLLRVKLRKHTLYDGTEGIVIVTVALLQNEVTKSEALVVIPRGRERQLHKSQLRVKYCQRQSHSE